MLRRLPLLAALLTLPLIANALPPGGVPVCTDPASQTGPQIAKLSDGFAIVWTEHRRGNYDIFAQKLDMNGAGLWQMNGNAVCDDDTFQTYPIVVDGGNGGGIFFWVDGRSLPPPFPNYATWGQRLTGLGQDGWMHNGEGFIGGCSSTGAVAMPDGAGGALMVYTSVLTPDGQGEYGYHIDSLGAVLWNGPVGEGTIQGSGPTQVISDGSVGFVVGWFEGHRTRGNCIFAERMTFSGHPLWDSVGVVMTRFSNPGHYGSHIIVPDATHGVIAAWSDNRSGNWDIYAQRVSGDSLVRWQTNGVTVRIGPGGQTNPKAVPDGQGGAIIVWENGASGDRDVFAQRLDSTGIQLWDTLGVPVIRSTGDQTGIQVVSDEAGRVIVTWKDNRNGNNDIYAQGLNPNGQRLWDTLGVQICVWNGEQTAPVICQDGSGGAVIVWQDTRNGNNDIYAQRISASGSGVCEEAVTSSVSRFPSSVRPNPFTSYTSVPGQEAERFALYDISGRKVGVYKGDRIGEGLSPGVYFLREAGRGSPLARIVKVR